jgi:polygalacturonase
MGIGNHETAIAPPPTPVFDVRAYGAKGDGKTYDTEAIQKAIDACAGTGGSVLLSGGSFVSAHLLLSGKMTFYIAKDATLLGGLSPEDYPVILPREIAEDDALSKEGKDCCRSLLYADKADGLRLDGGGVIDGRGALLTSMSGREDARPSLLRIYQSKDVSVRRLTLKNPRMWTEIYTQCEGLTIEQINVVAPSYVGNLDGLDLVDCRSAVVRGCDIESDDDGICIKTQHPKKGVSDILIENNRVASHAAGIKIGTATLGPISNVRILNNTVTRSGRDAGLSLMSVDGGVLRDIRVSGLEMSGVTSPFFFALLDRRERRSTAKVHTEGPGRFENVVVENVRVTQVKASPAANKPGTHTSIILGLPDAKIEGLTLRNMDIRMPGGSEVTPPMPKETRDAYPFAPMFGALPAWGFFVRHADGVVFENIRIETEKTDVRPWRVSPDAQVVDRNVVTTNR